MLIKSYDSNSRLVIRITTAIDQHKSVGGLDLKAGLRLVPNRPRCRDNPSLAQHDSLEERHGFEPSTPVCSLARKTSSVIRQHPPDASIVESAWLL